MNELNNLQALGLSLPSASYIFGAIVFGIVGYAAYRYGKKAGQARPKWTGVALMLFPYAVSETWLLYALGVGLCLSLYFLRE
jgi:F0F1-type ATP synthase membrane subunit c/vacuolar-type H+-ATPase subunit K